MEVPPSFAIPTSRYHVDFRLSSCSRFREPKLTFYPATGSSMNLIPLRHSEFSKFTRSSAFFLSFSSSARSSHTQAYSFLTELDSNVDTRCTLICLLSTTRIVEKLQRSLTESRESVGGFIRTNRNDEGMWRRSLVSRAGSWGLGVSLLFVPLIVSCKLVFPFSRYSGLLRYDALFGGLQLSLSLSFGCCQVRVK